MSLICELKRCLSTLILLSLLALCFSGCATVDSSVTPGLSLSGVRTVYVEHLGGKNRGIDKMIAGYLTQLGYDASYGSFERPGGVDAVLRYHDKWQWDITMYLIRLEVTVFDGDTNEILASGISYRPSVQRRGSRKMIGEVIDPIFLPESSRGR